MADFPLLKSGAVAQDGSSTTFRFATNLVRFADGGEQRFRARAGGKRRWVIRLELLSDEEAEALADFLEARQGRHGTFSFFDPWDEVEFVNCSLEEDIHALEVRGHRRTGLTVAVRQN